MIGKLFDQARQTTPTNALIFRICAFAALVLIVLLHYEAYRTYNKSADYAYGCDDYGYLRQARLFQQNGLIGGFNAALTDETTRYLIETFKNLSEPSAWDIAIGPHCQVYQPRVDRVVLNYPPLTGLFLALFKEGTQTRWALATADVLIITLLSFVALSGRVVTVPLLCLALGAFLFLGLKNHAWSRSIVGSTVLLTFLGYLTVHFAASWIKHHRPWVALPTGILLGLAVGFRIANVLLLAGFIAIPGIVFLRNPRWWTLGSACVAAAGFVIGVAPVLIFDAINAGGPFYTTYSSGNTQPISWTLETLQSGLQYFWAHQLLLRDSLVPAAATAVAIAVSLRRQRPELVLAASIAAVSLVVSDGFLLMHTPRALYYLNPAGAFAGATAVFCVIAAENQTVTELRAEVFSPKLKVAVVAAASMLAALLPRWMAMPVFEPQKMTASFAPRDIVWADMLGGTVDYYLDRGGGRLFTMSEELQDRIIAAVARDGRSQFLVVDSPTMEAVARRLRTRMELRTAGEVFGSAVFELRPEDARP